MKPILIGIISIIIIIFVFLVLVILLRIPISKGKILRPARLWVQLFCPPKDLFELVLNEEMDITKIGNVQTFKFKNKYILLGVLRESYYGL